MKTPYSPVIIIGMHRSGTTMITRMLEKLGLFVGWDVNDEHEATFFLERNENLLNVCGGSWSEPQVIDLLLGNPDLVQRVSRSLNEELNSMAALSFIGPLRMLKRQTPERFHSPWGWKDPRTTFLLPLYLQLFPSAKVIHIYRNGLDVAQSLAVREERRINTIDEHGIGHSLSGQRAQLKSAPLSVYAYRKLRNARTRLSTKRKYERYRINPCAEIENGFALWQKYVERAFAVTENIKNPVLTLRYEDFLVNAADHLQQMADFCQLNPETQKIEEIAAGVNPGRRFAYKEKANLMQFYETVKTTFWMEKLGYHLEPEAG